ncbi:MAG: FAD-dependent oxidoreductase [Chitinophagales bacterium]
MNFSYWEKTEFLNYDHIIIGSGITGLSTAIRLRELEPKSKVLILERGILPSGASTKNAGFACFGSLTEIIDDLENMSESECLGLIERRWKGLSKLRKNLGDDSIGYQACKGYELIETEQEKYLDQLGGINKMLQPIFKKNVLELCNHKIKDFGFSQKHIKHLLVNEFEGSVNTGMLMQSLLQKAAEIGIRIISGAEVAHWQREGNGVEVHCENGTVFRAQQLGICTNAFAKKLLPELDIRPGRGLVLVTKPLKQLPFEGIFHYDLGYYYFRNIDDRVLLGGGRNKDFETENTVQFGLNPLIKKDLADKLHQIIAPGSKPEIDYYWSGIMAFGANRTTLQGRANKHVAYALRLGGMGIAIGTLMGEELAERMLC